MKTTSFTCSRCKAEITVDHLPFTAGYGLGDGGNKVCYGCCAEEDKQYMRDHGKTCLYLLREYKPGSGYVYKITNWPGSLAFHDVHVKVGRHNIARVRYDCWFNFEGFVWHGVQYGDCTQIAHCKRTKNKSEK